MAMLKAKTTLSSISTKRFCYDEDCEKDADCTNGQVCQRCQCHKGTVETSQYIQGLPEGSGKN